MTLGELKAIQVKEGLSDDLQIVVEAPDHEYRRVQAAEEIPALDHQDGYSYTQDPGESYDEEDQATFGPRVQVLLLS